jgi:hypothetical protein
MFAKPVPQRRLPKRDADEFRKWRALTEKRSAAEERRQHAVELQDGAYLRAHLQALGVDPKEFLKTKAKRDRPAGPIAQMFPQTFQVATQCTDITVMVCQQRVCVDQPLGMNIDFIGALPGSQGTFTRPATNKFTTSDFVRGWDSWNWTYHRHHRTHSGGIQIVASAQLLEDAVVNGIGIEFRPEQSAGIGNGGWAEGDTYAALPDNTGRVQMSYRVETMNRPASGNWTPWHSTGNVMYLDHGPVNSNVAGIFTVLGVQGTKDVRFDTAGTLFRAGSEFILEANLWYWIDGNGLDGAASASYELRIHPYLLIESCTDQWPETVTIRVRDYLP